MYEAEIISVDTKASKAEVRFLGFGNKETKVIFVILILLFKILVNIEKTDI